MVISPLRRKVLRDLVRLWAQALAHSVVGGLVRLVGVVVVATKGGEAFELVARGGAVELPAVIGLDVARVADLAQGEPPLSLNAGCRCMTLETKPLSAARKEG